MNYDMTFCANEECHRKKHCRRNLKKEDFFYGTYSFAKFNPENCGEGEEK